MNLLSIDSIYQRISTIWQETAVWPDFIDAIQRVLPFNKTFLDPDRDPARWAILPGLCCQAAGGDLHWADRLMDAWFLFFTAAHLFDQVEDQDPAEEGMPEMAPGVTINLATGMLVAASFALNQMHQDVRVQRRSTQIVEDFCCSILTMCSGQHLDLIQGQPSLEQWMQISAAKSGEFFRLACRSGASLATDDMTKLDAYGGYGFHLGMLLQILDDAGDFQQDATSGDPVGFQNAGRSLAVAYARQVLPPDQLAILSENLATASHDAASAQEVTTLLKKCGAGLYMLTEIERQRSLGLQSLASAQPGSVARDTLMTLINELGSDPNLVNL